MNGATKLASVPPDLDSLLIMPQILVALVLSGALVATTLAFLIAAMSENEPPVGSGLISVVLFVVVVGLVSSIWVTASDRPVVVVRP